MSDDRLERAFYYPTRWCIDCTRERGKGHSLGCWTHGIRALFAERWTDEEVRDALIDACHCVFGLGLAWPSEVEPEKDAQEIADAIISERKAAKAAK